MKKITSLLIFTVFTVNLIYAQHTKIYTNPDYLFNQGKELFVQRKFAASYRSFEEFLKNTENVKAGQIHEAEFYMAANSYELRKDNASAQLKEFFYKHPYTPFYDKTNLMLGILEFEQKKYESAISYFNNINYKKLSFRERTDYLFSKGYACIATERYTEARDIFRELKSMNTRFNLTAIYYYAYSEYALGNYTVALPEFLAIESNPAYSNIVPYYIVHIYYAQKQYDKLYDKANRLLRENPDNKNNGEIYRILGRIAYEKKDYAGAVDNFKKSEAILPQVYRSDVYLFGLSFYQLRNYSEAVKYLSRAVTQRDEMSENAYLHLGNAYLKLNDKTNARLSYEAALRTSFNKSVREEAMYNYALTTYETTTALANRLRLSKSLFLNFRIRNTPIRLTIIWHQRL